jgi:hypothetical protein
MEPEVHRVIEYIGNSLNKPLLLASINFVSTKVSKCFNQERIVFSTVSLQQVDAALRELTSSSPDNVFLKNLKIDVRPKTKN